TPVVVVRPRFAPFINFEGVETIHPEADYEIAWTGSGNESLPDPNENTDPPPVEPPTAARSFSFEDGVTTGFSHNNLHRGGPTGNFLGLFGPETWDNPVTLAVDLLTEGTNATITFDLLIVDTWDGYNPQWSLPRGDTFSLMIDGTPISLDPFSAAEVAPYPNSRVSAGYLRGMTYGVTMTRT
ncbi:MAG: hypothetical protein ACK4GT_22880, partial [Pararhodobacter sp.]